MVTHLPWLCSHISGSPALGEAISQSAAWKPFSGFIARPLSCSRRGAGKSNRSVAATCQRMQPSRHRDLMQWKHRLLGWTDGRHGSACTVQRLSVPLDVRKLRSPHWWIMSTPHVPHQCHYDAYTLEDMPRRIGRRSRKCLRVNGKGGAPQTLECKAAKSDSEMRTCAATIQQSMRRLSRPPFPVNAPSLPLLG